MNLTDKVIGKIVDDMVVLVDTREQKNQHILDYLEANNIKYRLEKLDTADYSFVLPNYPLLNMDKQVLIEKKNSLEEISGNFTKGRDRFTREFERVTTEHIHLLIEGATWKKLLNNSYRSQISPKAFTASMLTWNIRYKCPIWFVGKEESPELLYNILKYELMEHLKKLRETGKEI